jgi:hypothetical protein
VHRLPPRIGQHGGPPVRHHDGPAGVQDAQHHQVGAEPPALGQPGAEVAGAGREAGHAGDPQVAVVVHGDDLRGRDAGRRPDGVGEDVQRDTQRPGVGHGRRGTGDRRESRWMTGHVPPPARRCSPRRDDVTVLRPRATVKSFS